MKNHPPANSSVPIKVLLYLLSGASFILMVSGWILPLLTVKVTFDVPLLGPYTVLDETRSLFGTVVKLTEDGNWVPAFLISFFGIILPALKTSALAYEVLGLRASAKRRDWLFRINKWAMADVFSMSIIIAFFTAKAMGNISAVPQTGFYVFAAYVIISGITAQLLSEFKVRFP